MFFVPRSDEHRHLLPSVKAIVDGGVPLIEGDVVDHGALDGCGNRDGPNW